MKILKLLLNKVDDDKLKLSKAESGDNWTVKKGYSVLYIGSKEKCKLYISQSAMS